MPGTLTISPVIASNIMTIKPRRIWTVVILTVVAAIVALFSVHFLVGWLYYVSQNDMYPGLPAGSWIVGLKRPRSTDVAHGDIVLFEREEGGRTLLCIGRVIGVPGDTIET